MPSGINLNNYDWKSSAAQWWGYFIRWTLIQKCANNNNAIPFYSFWQMVYLNNGKTIGQDIPDNIKIGIAIQGFRGEIGKTVHNTFPKPATLEQLRAIAENAEKSEQLAPASSITADAIATILEVKMQEPLEEIRRLHTSINMAKPNQPQQQNKTRYNKPRPNYRQGQGYQQQHSFVPQQQYIQQQPVYNGQQYSQPMPAAVQNPYHQQQQQQQQDDGSCQNCGMFCGTNCPARNKECFNCHKIGHYGRKCRGSQKSGQNPLFTARDSRLSLGICQRIGTEKNTSIIDINGRKTHALIDTGAEITCCSFDFYSKLALSDKLSQSDIPSIKGVSGHRLQVLGKVNLPISFKGAVFNYHVYVIDGLHHSFNSRLGFLHANKINIDFSKSVLQVPDKENADIPKVCMIQTSSTGLARTYYPVTISPFCEMNVGVKISKRNSGEIVLLEPVSNLVDSNLTSAKCLVKIIKKRAVIRLMNPTNQEIHIPATKVLASVSDIDSNFIHDLDNNMPSVASLQQFYEVNEPIHFDFSTSDLSLEQRQKMSCLL
ncbi:unnamed protein product [Mytilus edulis]|uniref:CCHC-type domain-containing protein n=1 Tax=Mytilus edulis TaxID=6550 RepID=A0A8S3QU99_MYTED|nr:unnamed protein product [Mytilus edulis]